jgi:hypothetical protein
VREYGGLIRKSHEKTLTNKRNRGPNSTDQLKKLYYWGKKTADKMDQRRSLSFLQVRIKALNNDLKNLLKKW